MALFNRLELVFAYSTERTYPIVGKVGKCGSGFDAVVRVTCVRVINPVANFTYIFLHNDAF